MFSVKATGPAAVPAFRPRAIVQLASKNDREATFSARNIQVEHLARRFGLSPSVSVAIAVLAFGEARS